MLESIRELAGRYVINNYRQEPAWRAEHHRQYAAQCTQMATYSTELAAQRPELGQGYMQLASQQTTLNAIHIELLRQESQTLQAPLSKAEYNKRIDDTLATIQSIVLVAFGLLATAAVGVAAWDHFTTNLGVALGDALAPRGYGYIDPKALLFTTALVHAFSMPLFAYGLIACSVIYLLVDIARQSKQNDPPLLPDARGI